MLYRRTIGERRVLFPVNILLDPYAVNIRLTLRISDRYLANLLHLFVMASLLRMLTLNLYLLSHKSKTYKTTSE